MECPMRATFRVELGRILLGEKKIPAMGPVVLHAPVRHRSRPGDIATADDQSAGQGEGVLKTALQP